jgi:crotonobetainyl-CoA:carnitine CoA-transferase CaiB-like acyl-CoA transferase
VGALDGIRVVDFSQHFAGPGTTMYLADQGAEVIKIEPPKGGHDRRSEPFSNTFLLLNRGKRSIALDIRTPSGHEVASALVKTADVVLIAWPPGQAERLGYGYEAMRELNPRLIYASVTGWGNNGAMAGQLGYDRLHQAYTGIMANNTLADGSPVPLPFFLADEAIPAMLAYGIALALLARERTGQGQKVETSQLDAQIAMQSLHFVFAAGREEYSLPRQSHTYGTSDGRYLTLSPLTDADWSGLWRALELPEADLNTARGREAAMDRIRATLAERFAQAPLEHWLGRLAGEAVPFAPVLTRAEFLRQPQAWDNDMLAIQEHPEVGRVTMMGVPVRLSTTAGAIGSPAPSYGQHTREVLAELGFGDARIEQLYAERTVF